ncbi:nuclear pore complex protein Nup153-like [Pollicipes pollicipes]|uniref:nuclear pore complex protein Nup153-like n=1 Tax=Pollicipes pollicipes TaxID=41117 RepID=UPI0018849D2A|nr:nuclear pore complex protein Nup153-like [Pollicipes pollicipes]
MTSQGGGKARDKLSHRNKPYERRRSLLGRLTGTVSRLLPEAWVPAWLQEEEQQQELEARPPPPELRPGPSSAATRRNHLNAAAPPWSQVPPPVSGIQPGEDEDGRLMADTGGGGGGSALVSHAVWSRTATPGRPQPAALSSKRPRFRPAALSASLSQDDAANSSLNRSGAAVSPFYPGPTVYGGAANHRRLRVPPPTSVGPYQVRPRAVPVRAADGDDELTMSTTARRILSVLEGMSTPVTDARRAPPAAGPQLLDASFGSQRRAGLYGAHGARLGRPRPDNPPVHRVVSPARVTVEPNRRRPSPGAVPAAAQHATEDAAARRVTFSSQPTPVAAPAQGGKMRRQKESRHYSSRPGADPGELPPSPVALPDVSLPFTSLRPFSLSTSTPKPPPAEPAKRPAAAAAAAVSTDFIFSSPRPVCPPGAGLVNGLADGADDLTFAFSVPAALDAPGQVLTPTATPTLAGAGSWGDKFRAAPGAWECAVCMLQNKAGADRCIACQAARTGGAGTTTDPPAATAAPSPPAAAAASSWGDKFKPAAGAWTCDVCMITNKPDATKCVACQTPNAAAAKPSVASAPAPETSSAAPAASWGDKFKPVPGEWTCDTCMLKNNPDSANCVACETPNSKAALSSSAAAPAPAATTITPASSWGDKFKPVAGEWTCDTCMVTNKPDSSKCVACQTPNPKAASANASPAAASKPAQETWECTTCLVRNKPAVSKCAACDSPRPEARAQNSEPYQFKSAQPPAAGAFVFGFGDSQKAPTTKSTPSSESDGFRFGVTPPAAPASAGFSFGFGAPASTGGQESAEDAAPAARPTPAVNFNAGSPGSPRPLKRRSAAADRPADKAAPELNTGSIMDVLGKSSPGVGGDKAPTPSTVAAEEPKINKVPSVSPANGVFSFGATSAAKDSGAATTFAFGAGSQGSSGGSAPTPGFSFGSGTSSADKSSSGAPPASDKSAPAFMFGAKASETAEKPSGGFSFGAKTSVASDNVAEGSPFGAKTAAGADKSAAGFSFGAKPAETCANVADGVPGGMKPSASVDQNSGGFVLGAKVSDSSVKHTDIFSASANPSATVEKPTGSFSFGAKAPEGSEKPPGLLSFGDASGKSGNPAATFSFGSSSTPAAKPAKGFSFGGGTTAASTAAAPSGGFAFSTAAAGAASSAGFPAAPPSVPAGGFAFGAATTNKTESSALFTFGATSVNGPSAKKAATADGAPASAVFQFGSGPAAAGTAAATGDGRQ